MIAIQFGTTVLWILACVAGALALLALVVAVARAFGARPSRKVLTRAALGVGAAAVLVPVGALVIYTQVINKPEPEFDQNDLANLVNRSDDATTTAGALVVGFGGLTLSSDSEPGSSTPDSGECAADTAASTPADETTAAPSDGSLDGEWVIAEGSEFGYRVPETLAGVDTEATGRGSEITGSFTVAGNEVGEACFVVQVASITSDQSLRDSSFNGRIMETSEFPTAQFVLTEPIVLDELPTAGGDAVTTEATGDLTLHGVTQSVTFEVTVQAGEPDDDGAVVVGVLGQIPITFADYDISDPSGGPAQVGDDGTLEFLLAFEPA